MDTFWVPGVNHLKSKGRWTFAEFRQVYAIEADFAKAVEDNFKSMIAAVAPGTAPRTETASPGQPHVES